MSANGPPDKPFALHRAQPGSQQLISRHRSCASARKAGRPYCQTDDQGRLQAWIEIIGPETMEIWILKRKKSDDLAWNRFTRVDYLPEGGICEPA